MREFIRDLVRKFDARWSFFASLPLTGRLLEIGCGRGANCLALRQIRPELEICGLDMLPDTEIPAFMRYLQHNLEQLPLPYPDAYFDAILLIHVIEHLPNPLVLCGEINRLLKPQGKFYLEAPNYTTIFVPSLSLGRAQHHPLNFYDDLDHRRPYTQQALFEFLERCQLQVARVGNTRNWWRLPLNLMAIPWHILKGDRVRVLNHFWNLFGWCIFAVGQKP